MLKDVTRAKAIQVWFAAVALVFVAAVAFGVTVTLGTGSMLAALSFVPPVIIFLLWPGPPSPTAGDVLHGPDHRG